MIQIICGMTAAMLTKKHLLLFEVILTLEKLKRKEGLDEKEADILVNGIKQDGFEDANESEASLTPEFGNPKSSTHNIYKQYYKHLEFLESMIPQFEGLITSFSTYEMEWAEYFSSPVISLVIPTPVSVMETVFASLSKSILTSNSG